MRNFETEKLKVNDTDGNPIEIAAVVVWRVVDTAEAVFEVDDYENFVHVQSESALRNLATRYPYDSHGDARDLAARLDAARSPSSSQREIQDRLAQAGVEVIEARISHLAYAPEIAQAMLQRQQAVGDHRRAAEDRRRRGRHGRDGARAALERRRSSSSTRSARRRWCRTCSSSCAATGRRSPWSTPARSTPAEAESRWPNARRSCSGSTRSSTTPSQRWAADELRSLNAQIEFLLRRALADGGCP